MSHKKQEDSRPLSVSQMDDSGEEKLISSARNGDKKAYGELIMVNQKRLYRTVYLIVGNFDAAQDMVQEAFVKGWQAIESFETGRPFYPWISRIARNLALNYIKREKRSQSLDDMDISDERVVDQKESPLDDLVLKENNKRLAEAIKSLPENFRAVFVLRMYEKMSYAEIAKALNISPGTVDSRLYRAREKLMELLKNELG